MNPPRIPRYDYTEASVWALYAIGLTVLIGIAWWLCSGGHQ